MTVQSEPRGERVRIAVTDTDRGLRREEAERAFDRFDRDDRYRAASSGQSVLGLAIAKSILELHGSEVAVESEPGHGASFYFDLPIVVPPPRSRTHRVQREQLADVDDNSLRLVLRLAPRRYFREVFVRVWRCVLIGRVQAIVGRGELTARVRRP